jgi:hypothetical protein
MERRGFLATCAAALGIAAVPKAPTRTLSKIVLRPGILTSQIYVADELLAVNARPDFVTGTGVNQPLGILTISEHRKRKCLT